MDKEYRDNPLDEPTATGLLDSLAKAVPQSVEPPSFEPHLEGDIPVLPLRNTVLFPDVIIPVSVGRKKSIAVLENLGSRKTVVFTSQKDSEKGDPKADDLYRIGTVGLILKSLKMPDGSMNIIVQGLRTVGINQFTQIEPFFSASVTPIEMRETMSQELGAYARTIKQVASQVIELSPNIPSEASYAVQNIESTPFLIHFLASNLNVNSSEKQAILELSSYADRADKLIEYLSREVKVLELSKQIQTKVKLDMDKVQREFYLRQQLKTIQNELGEFDGQVQETNKFKELLAKKNLSKETQEIVEKEIERLARIPQASPDYGVTRTYLETILALPWNEYTATKINLKEAGRILNEDHYGLEKVKQRILEYLAVLKLKSNMKAPILCFLGPPGVGKTSLGKSIARALGRKFVRISLGGVRDESEIRGHRRTYIGAMPGRIIQGLRRAGSSDAVFMLDEIDKIGHDHRGDPSSALLEVLDPAQNSTFSDHYLEIAYDLSRVMFIATANTLDSLSAPLRDRMEVININGYTDFEKLHIANQYLIPRQMEEHGIKSDFFELDNASVLKIINSYTREAGVRNLEREIAGICRSVAKDIAFQLDDDESATPIKIQVKTDDLKKYLGLEKFYPEVSEPVTMPGVAVGLAWTAVGGDILFIESTVTKGSGRLILTGQLGDVMRESAQAALSYLKSCAEYFKIPDEAFKYWDVHLHIPQGAIPKDGPSAGVTILTSLASIFTQRNVKGKIAMTGEITLRGHILPVGGIKSKILAASRAGITEILLPERNRNEILEAQETAKDMLNGMSFKFFDEMDDLLDYVLEPISEEEALARYLPPQPEPEAPIQNEEELHTNKESVAAKKGDQMIRFE
ncbi:MAG: endopeptidase La [Chloroherpetonaceae bacterium]|nr:endopeptidase La [Chloroherpetonaceae bacterium]